MYIKRSLIIGFVSFATLFSSVFSLLSEESKLQIESISIENSGGSNEVTVCFNQKVASSDLLPDRNRKFKYNYEFRIVSQRGWETSSKSALSNLSIEDNVRKDNKCYVITTIGPTNSIKKDYSKGDIKSIQVKLFERNSSDAYQQIHELEAQNL
ncbi:MAG: hypothetical protein H7A24_16695 [Leptospiraceae bacterium]|nr:hypothetical protein [Leptospiraceae bacterium]MCP5513529.1 hypothetical protein [Leptospiraceae bacterium]